MTGRPVIVIAGPTACGKTGLSLLLANHLGAEIISADSRQIYRGLDIGTAKPEPRELSAVRHHLINILEPDRSYSAAAFVCRAREAMNQMDREGIRYIIAGGSGLYLKALIEGLSPIPPADPAIRQELSDLAQQRGAPALHQMLGQVDPPAAARIKQNDRDRLIRALEVFRLSGIPLSQWQRGKRERDHRAYQLYVLNRTRSDLYSRIERRVDQMVARGLFRETRELLERGFVTRSPGLRTVGYRESIDFIEGRISREEAVRLIKQNTRRYAKRQLTWFRGMLQSAWIDLEEGELWEKAIGVISPGVGP